MAVIDRPYVLARLATMLLDPEVQVGNVLPGEYAEVVMAIGWWGFYQVYDIDLCYLYTGKEPLSQEMVDAFSTELGWAEMPVKNPEEDIWL